MLRFAAALAVSVVVSLQPATAQQSLYAITGAGNVESILYRVDPATGQAQMIGDLGTTHVTALSFSTTTGLLYGHISNGPATTQFISINPTNGAFSVIGDTHQQVPDMSFRSDGTLFAWSKNNFQTGGVDDLYRVDVSTAQATIVGEAGFSSTMVGLSFGPGGTLYMKDANNLYTLDQSTGLPTFVRGLTGPALANALAFDSAGTPFSVNRNGTRSFLETFDMNTGAITQIGEITSGGAPVNGVAALAFTPIPEPATLSLLGAAGAAGWWFARRRSARSSAPRR